MKVTTETIEKRDRVVALGTFDGVHLGHQSVLEVAAVVAMCEKMQAGALTFLNHPLSVVGKGAPPLLNLPAEKALLLSRCLIEEALVLPFTRRLSELSPEDFLEGLTEKVGARHLVVGENYTFGAKGEGNVEMLSRLSGHFGYVLHVVPKVRVSGMEVSSTQIRKLLLEGDVRSAQALLGRAYSIGGPVVHGNRIGRTLGFPTINLRVPEGKLLPKYGVYFGYAQTDGKQYRAILNLGVKPTVGSPVPVLEAHLLDYEGGELYGKAARISFVARLRGEKRFDSLQELSRQLERDKERVQSL